MAEKKLSITIAIAEELLIDKTVNVKEVVELIAGMFYDAAKKEITKKINELRHKKK